MNNQQQQQRKPKSKAARPKQKKVAQNTSSSSIKRAPVAMTQVIRTENPVFSVTRKGADIVVRHSEYLRDIPGSVGFSVTTIPVQPGLDSSFPWLSCMANLYESYILEDLCYEFQTMAPTTTTGTVMSAVDYDASDPAPLDKTQLASYQGYARSSPWNSFKQRSPKEDLHKQKTYFVRSSPLAANQDVKLYDVGNFFIATQGQADTASIGELYVHYSVRFSTPQLGNIAVGMSKSSKITTSSSATAVAAGSNAPLVSTGLTGSGAITLTAIAPFNCLITETGFTSAGTSAPNSAGSTCTVQNETVLSVVSAPGVNSYVYIAELAFIAGQTFVFNIGGGATWASNVARIAQYNTLVL